MDKPAVGPKEPIRWAKSHTHLHQLALNSFFRQLGSLTPGTVLSIMTSDFNLFFEIIDRGPVEIFGYF